MSESIKIKNLATALLEIEAQAIKDLLPRIDDKFVAACKLILKTEGRVVVTGMGKSGHIGNKIAATLASTGTPAFFMHPGEASHGDLGMITKRDVVLSMSYSGSTHELVSLLPTIKLLDVPMIAMTGDDNSELAKHAHIHLNVSVKKEACPLGLAPTASTTATLAMGDALAIALLEARGFTADDFAFSHPGGALGKRLLLSVADVMRKGDDLPIVQPAETLSEVLVVMSQKNLGVAVVIDDDKIAGIFTDGDLRRAVDKGVDMRSVAISEVMTKAGINVNKDTLAAEALQIMEDKLITTLLVVSDDGKLEGVLHLHDLLRAGIM